MSTTAVDDQLTLHPDDAADQARSTFRIGDHEVSEPIRRIPIGTAAVFVPDPLATCLYSQRGSRDWGDNLHQIARLGLAHLTKEAAIAHAKALIAVSGGKV